MNTEMPPETTTRPADNIAFPALFEAADQRSARAQSFHFALTLGEYIILVSTALMALFDEIDEIRLPAIYYAISFLLLIVVGSLSHFSGLDNMWYRCRAAAETTKALSWRYMMRAPPFLAEANETMFRKRAAQVAELDKHLRIALDTDLITDDMKRIRNADLASRRVLYLNRRVQDQTDWYAGKAKTSGTLALRWYLATCAVYSVPVALILSGLIDAHDEWALLSLCLLVGSSMLGWTKSKRFRELAISYKDAGREIRSLSDTGTAIDTDDDFASFVDKIENAFLREHMSWVINKN